MRLFFAKFSAALRAGFYLYVFLLPANTTKLELKRFATNKTPPPFFHAFIFRKSQIKNPEGGFYKGGGFVSMSAVR